MRLIRNNNTDPHLNLAIEEWLLINSSPECFMLWRNRPAVIVGRNQNTAEEINPEYVAHHKIPVVRRMTGGGAVYHDLGNLNFTFISRSANKLLDFRRFAQPIIDVLAKVGVNAEFSGRNDMIIDGRKFSGNAQFVRADRVLHHGTLLFDADLTIVQEALRVQPEKYASKGVKSVASRVTNIAAYLPQRLTIDEFAAMIISHIAEIYKEAVVDELRPHELSAAEDLVRTKYGLWEWNFGKSPQYNFRNRLRFANGLIECRLFIEDGLIRTGKIYGDFFGNRPAEELVALLAGVRHEYDAISAALDKLDLRQYFAGIDRDEILKVLV